MNDLRSVLEELTAALQSTKNIPKNASLPAMLGVAHREISITQWLGYLLTPDKNGYGTGILNALLQLCSGAFLVNKDETVSVFTESTFSDKRRIDILIRTDRYVIGIENKLWSGEQENQTADYTRSLKAIAEKEHKQPIGIYLHPDKNTSKPAKSFFDITYTDFAEALRPLSGTACPVTREAFLLREFIRYVEDTLMDKFPELTKDVQTYAAYLPQITEAQSAYRNYADGILRWFADAYNAQDQELKITNTYATQKHYVLRKARWDQLDFHIEVIWKDELAFARKLTLEAHIEGNRDQNAPKAMLIKEIFGISDTQRSHGHPLLVSTVACDFSSEEKALDSLQKLNEALQLFHDLSEKADECLKRLKDCQQT